MRKCRQKAARCLLIGAEHVDYGLPLLVRLLPPYHNVFTEFCGGIPLGISGLQFKGSYVIRKIARFGHFDFGWTEGECKSRLRREVHPHLSNLFLASGDGSIEWQSRGVVRVKRNRLVNIFGLRGGRPVLVDEAWVGGQVGADNRLMRRRGATEPRCCPTRRESSRLRHADA